MRRRGLALFILAAVLVTGGIVVRSWKQREAVRPVASTANVPGPADSAPSQSATATMPGAAPSFAERILADYGDAARPPEEDMRAMARTLENFALLVKGDNPLPLGANEEIAAALRGKNKAGLRALAGDHRVFDVQGRIVDRWGTPLFFHAQSRDRLEIRSAGPDRQMWTEDDLHRKQDGGFLRGDGLLAPSLFDEKRAAK